MLNNVLEVTDTKTPISNKIIALNQYLPCAEESKIIPESIPAIAQAIGECQSENATKRGINKIVPAPNILKLKMLE